MNSSAKDIIKDYAEASRIELTNYLEKNGFRYTGSVSGSKSGGKIHMFTHQFNSGIKLLEFTGYINATSKSKLYTGYILSSALYNSSKIKYYIDTFNSIHGEKSSPSVFTPELEYNGVIKDVINNLENLGSLNAFSKFITIDEEHYKRSYDAENIKRTNEIEMQYGKTGWNKQTVGIVLIAVFAIILIAVTARVILRNSGKSIAESVYKNPADAAITASKSNKTAPNTATAGKDAALTEAFLSRNPKNMLDALNKKKVSPKYKTQDNYTLMHFAATFDKAGELTKRLAKAGVSFTDAEAKKGNTPLHSAVAANNMKFLSVAESKKAKFSVINNDGETLLIMAARKNNTPMVIHLLKMQVINPNFMDVNGQSALDYAVKNNNHEMTKFIEHYSKQAKKIMENKPQPEPETEVEPAAAAQTSPAEPVPAEVKQ